MIRRCVAGWALVGVWSAVAVMGQTQDTEVVVSASRIPRPSERVGSSITVVSADEIERRGAIGVPELLEAVPGAHVARNGGVGHTAALYLRGANPEQVVVLLNGIRVNDPLGFGRGADLAGLDAGNIERIEILRGPQSSLYGSDAMAGVVNIVTKRGAGAPRYTASAEAGSYGTFREHAAVSGSLGTWHYAVDATRLDSEGFSVADEANGNTEDDGCRNTTLSARTGGALGAAAEWELFAQSVEEAIDLDNSHGGLADAYGDVQERTSLYTRGRLGLDLFDSAWRQTLRGGVSTHQRDYRSDDSTSTFDATLYEADWQHDFQCGEDHVLSLGAAGQEEIGESASRGASTNRFGEKSARTVGLYVEENFVFWRILTGAAAVRWDDHEAFGDAVTWRLAPACQLWAGGRVKGSYGTGFKAPSLYQLYSSYGRPDLEPEKAQGWDAGLEQEIGEKQARVGASYFHNRYTSLIDFDYVTWKYANVAKATTQGVETYASWRLVESVAVRLAYTYTDAKDGDDVPLNRQPKDRVSADLDVQPVPGVTTRLSAVYVGERPDHDFDAKQTVDLKAYTLVNLAASWQAWEHVRLFGRIENILDEQYQEVFGYGTAGLSGYAGAECTF